MIYNHYVVKHAICVADMSILCQYVHFAHEILRVAFYQYKMQFC